MREIGQRGGMGRKGGGEREGRYKRRLKMEGRRGGDCIHREWEED